ncbi:MAG: glucose 1-dehydrogenase [Thermodesulfobacteriota bacterium]
MEPELIFPTFSLSGRKALVTGASRGIGRALALGLAAAGARVVLAGREEVSLAAVKAEIEALGGWAATLTLDVRDAAGLPGKVDAAAAALGGLDILINNAGTENVRPSLEVDPALWNDIVDTNLRGAFFCAQAAGRIMAQSGGGAMINVCSLTSSVGVPTAAPYTSSKTGLLGLTRALAAEWARLDIRVNAIAPGYFRTRMTEIFFQNKDWSRAMLEKIPLGRFGHVQDLIGVTVFLCGDAAAYITGQMITVDGGYLASI